MGCQRGRVKRHRSRSVATGGRHQLPADRGTLSSMSRSRLVTAGRAAAPAGRWPPARQTEQLPPPCRGPRGPPRPRPFPRGGDSGGVTGAWVPPSRLPPPPRAFLGARVSGKRLRVASWPPVTRVALPAACPGNSSPASAGGTGRGAAGVGGCQGTRRRHSARDPRCRVRRGCWWHRRRLSPPSRGPSWGPWGAARRCRGWVAVPVAPVASPRPGLGRVTRG